MKGQNTRSNSQKNNGHRRSNSRFSNQGQTPSPTRGGTVGTNNPKAHSNVTSNEKVLGKIGRSVGKRCTVSLATGVKHEGILASADISPPKAIVISNPKTYGKSVDKGQSEKRSSESLTIQLKNVIDFEVDGFDSKQGKKSTDRADVESTSNTKDLRQDEAKFKTDSDISGKAGFEERELQRWAPDVDDGFQMTLEESADNGGNGHWDQFEVNEKKFGVESTYDEHYYTTRINTSAPDYEQRLKKADRIAKEIESQATNNLHILEERGVQLDDSGLDEEDKYSGVDRRGDELLAALKGTSISNTVPPTDVHQQGPGKYVPPRQRAAHYHNDPAIVASSITNQNRNADDPKSKQQAVKSPVNSTKPSKPDSIPPKPPVNNQSNESFRLNARSEINSLREFSANFKIPHKMPTDLLPILSKDKIKQDEILKKQHQKQKREQENKAAAQNSPNANQDPNAPKKKLDASKPTFKPNPKAAAFTPSSKPAQTPSTTPRTNYYRSPNNPSPRLSHSRPYSSGTSSGNSSGGGSSKRHQISPAEFFGGADKVPTKEDQEKKIQSFRFAFNLFITTKKKHEEKKTPLVFEKTFQTPPTWDYTVDETHDKLFASGAKLPGYGIGGNVPFLSSPLVGTPVVASGYPTPNGTKYPLSPQQHTAAIAAQFQQQQIHAAMMYQQFPGASSNQPMHLYGGDPAFLPPAGFVPPPSGFVAGGSPVNGNLVLNSPHYNGSNHNLHYNHHHGNNRRYNSQNQSSSPNKRPNSNQQT